MVNKNVVLQILASSLKLVSLASTLMNVCQIKLCYSSKLHVSFLKISLATGKK